MYNAIILICATACASTQETPTLSPLPTLSSVPPTETASSEPRAVTFTTTDGATLNGTLYGAGKVAVIFSNMGDKRQDSWAEMAEAVAAEGYSALTYDFRYWVNDEMVNRLIKFVADDLSAAAEFVRSQGAERIVMVGASMGGMATAKAAASSDASAAIIIAAPMDASSAGVVVASTEVQAITVPKLFITTERDHIVDTSALQQMYEVAIDPKELEVYPGTAHGTGIFQTESGSDLQTRILSFITTNAPLDPALIPTQLPSPTPHPNYFVVYGDGPVVTHGESGSWDDRFTDPGAVIFHDGQFLMFRNGFREWPGTVQIGYATSPDGYTWTKQGDEPVLKTENVPYAGVAALASSALVEDDGTWVLYFYTWQSTNYPSAGGIGRATAPAPTGPWTVDAELVLTDGSASEWDGSHVLAPDVFRTEAGYVMYYSGYNLTGIQMIGMATSPDGTQWTKYDDPATITAPFAESDPVLQPSPHPTWDSDWVHQPRVRPMGDKLIMFYRSQSGSDTALGYATSDDGIHWERGLANPVVSAHAVPGAQYFWFTNVVYHDDTYFLYWEIDKRQSTEIYLATHEGGWP